MYTFPEFVVYGGIMLLLILFAVIGLLLLVHNYMDIMGRTKGKITTHEIQLRKELIDEVTKLINNDKHHTNIKIDKIHEELININNNISIANNSYYKTLETIATDLVTIKDTLKYKVIQTNKQITYTKKPYRLQKSRIKKRKKK